MVLRHSPIVSFLNVPPLAEYPTQPFIIELNEEKAIQRETFTRFDDSELRFPARDAAGSLYRKDFKVGFFIFQGLCSFFSILMDRVASLYGFIEWIFVIKGVRSEESGGGLRIVLCAGAAIGFHPSLEVHASQSVYGAHGAYPSLNFDCQMIISAARQAETTKRM